MSSHQGQLLQSIIRKSGISVFQLSKTLKYSIESIHHHIEMTTLDYNVLKMYGEALDYDFSKNFPEMDRLTKETFDADVQNNDCTELIKDRDHWRNKYVNLLERHSDLLKRRLNMPS